MSIIHLIDDLLADAARARASDIHLIPASERVRVRLRIDGRLEDREPLAKAIHAEVISRIKIMAGLRTDEHQAAQDGRFRVVLAEAGTFDVRVSVAPTHHGENAVLRLLPERPVGTDLAALGFPTECRERAERAVRAPHGLIIAAGATGSGKTTTLYALASLLDAAAVSLATIEDPVEYAIEDATQIPVNGRAGLTFATGLRAILRQDPDVIMVGEIRDAETAALAASAALTGHLVLTTLHANDAATVLPRLLDLKVEPYLIAAAVTLVIGQRLVRRVCEACRRKGCQACRGTGYRGRIGLYEALSVDGEARDATASMREDGLAKVCLGVTTMEEILRAHP